MSKRPAPPTGERIGVEYRRLGALVPWGPTNPKKHDLAAIERVMVEHGFADPLIEDARTGRIAAGNGRVETLLAMKAASKAPPRRILVDQRDGEWLVPVVTGVSFDTEEQAIAFVIGHNRVTELGGWDQKILDAQLKVLRDAKIDLTSMGFSVADTQRRIAGATAGATERVRKTLADFDTRPPPMRAWLLIATREDKVPEVETLLREHFGDGDDFKLEISIGVHE